MTTYAWPGWNVTRFEWHLMSNTRVFTGPYTPTVQTTDLLGERWGVRIDIAPTISSIEGAAREAFSNRLKGPVNRIALYHLRRPVPQGTMRGAPVLTSAVAQLANTASITTTAGATLLAGDMIGFGGQVVMLMADAVADGTGLMSIEFQPRARVAIAANAAVAWNQPAATFLLKTDGVVTAWVPGLAEGTSFDLIESY